MYAHASLNLMGHLTYIIHPRSPDSRIHFWWNAAYILHFKAQVLKVVLAILQNWLSIFIIYPLREETAHQESPPEGSYKAVPICYR